MAHAETEFPTQMKRDVLMEISPFMFEIPPKNSSLKKGCGTVVKDVLDLWSSKPEVKRNKIASNLEHAKDIS